MTRGQILVFKCVLRISSMCFGLLVIFFAVVVGSISSGRSIGGCCTFTAGCQSADDVTAPLIVEDYPGILVIFLLYAGSYKKRNKLVKVEYLKISRNIHFFSYMN